MIIRLSNVKFSVFNPEQKKWIAHSDMTVLLSEDFIYYVKSEPFYNAIMEKLKLDDDYNNCQIKSKKETMFSNKFREFLDSCPITDELQGEMLSGSVLWKVEREENPSRKHNQTIEVIESENKAD